MKILDAGQYIFSPEALKKVSLVAWNAAGHRFEYHIIIPKGLLIEFRASGEDEITEIEFTREKRLEVPEFRKPLFEVALVAKSSSTASLVLQLDDFWVISAMLYHA